LAALAVAGGQLAADEHLDPRAGRGDLGVAVQLADDLLGPRLDLSRVGVAAVVQIDAREVVALGEHEAAAVEAVPAVVAQCLADRRPGRRVGGRRLPACLRVVRHLRPPLLAPLIPPADPLSTALSVEHWAALGDAFAVVELSSGLFEEPV